MKIQYCSDLHLEFSANREFLLEHPIKPMADLLVLAGDVMPFAHLDRHQNFISYLSDHFETVFWIPGNHEYYKSDIQQRTGSFEEKIRDNVILLNNTVKYFGDVKLVFSTLWSAISPENAVAIQRALYDFKLIRSGDRLFNTVDFTNLFRENFAFLNQAISMDTHFKKVVVTHHVPTMLHYPAQYKGSVINQAFATELSGFIQESEIANWIYGHHHYNSTDFKIGNTKLLTNQLGYVQKKEHLDFKNGLVLEL